VVGNNFAVTDGKSNSSHINDDVSLARSDVIILCTVSTQLSDPTENVITSTASPAAFEKGRRVKFENPGNEIVTL